MEPSTYSHFTTSRYLTYSYKHRTPAARNEGNYILFLHGFPSSSYDWHHQINHFSKKGYGILAPDLLGYGGTSKPLDVQAYKGKMMAQDIAEILQHEKIGKVVGVAHDWGSFLLSRLANYYPSPLSKLIFLDVGYSAPGFGLTREVVNYINSTVQEAKGFSIFGYFLFFAEDDASSLMDQHSESVRSLFYSRDEDLQKKYMGAVGGIREWLTEGRIAEPEPFSTSKDQLQYQKTFEPTQGGGGYAAPIRWYIAQLKNVNSKDDEEIPEVDRIVKQPTLLVSSSHVITSTADFPSQIKRWVSDLRLEHLDCGHWVQIEKPDEVNQMIENFIETKR